MAEAMRAYLDVGYDGLMRLTMRRTMEARTTPTPATWCAARSSRWAT